MRITVGNSGVTTNCLSCYLEKPSQLPCLGWNNLACIGSILASKHSAVDAYLKRPHSFQKSQETKLFVWQNHWTIEKPFVIWSNRTTCVSLQCGWQSRASKNMFLSSGQHRHQLRASLEVLKQHLMSQVAIKWALLGKSKEHIQNFGNCHFIFAFFTQRTSTVISNKFSWALQ